MAIMIELEDILFEPNPTCKIYFVTEWECDDAVDAYYSSMYCQEDVDRLIHYLEMNNVEFWVENT